ncbi:uncharacterized protein LOC143154870 [Ptiloglossa arizonensis]|uniref:uncharacterized protein LOC143154870 n=1 Tax=Ptiloglossa arizonensis TaxID=3350558 RepID=UPI003FA1753E
MTRYSKNRYGWPVKHNRYEGKKRIQTKESSEFKICTGWTHEWISPNKLRKYRGLNVHEIVRGPFSSPKLLQTRPFLAVPSCYAQENCSSIQYGIPDAWREYLASRGYCGVTETRVLQQNLIPCYVRCFATDRLWNELGLPFAQGIPDPWKCRSPQSRQFVGCTRRRNTCNKKTSARIASNYDGDDEAEIERTINKHDQFNEDDVDGKKDLFQDRKNESHLPLVKQEVIQKFENTLKEVKKNGQKAIDQSGLGENFKLLRHPRKHVEKLKGNFETVMKEAKKTIHNVQEIKEHVSTKPSIQRKDNLDTLMHNQKQFLQNHQSDFHIRPTIKKNFQVDSVQKANESLQTVETQQPLNIICCNCNLQRCIVPNIPYSPDRANSFREKNVSEYVMCQNCESIYRKSSPQRLDFAAKTVNFCVPDPKKSVQKQKIVMHSEIYKQTKLKLCACFQKAKHYFEESNQRTIEKKDTIDSKKDLELVCCKCNCPYLKIASIYTNTIDQRERFHARKQSSNRRQIEQNTENRERRQDHVLKCSPMRKQKSNTVRDSKNHYCTRVENKTFVSTRDLEETRHTTTVKRQNDATNENFNEIPKKTSRDVDTVTRSRIPVRIVNEKVKRNSRNVVRTSFHHDAGQGEVIATHAARRLPKNPVQHKRTYIVTGDAPPRERRGEKLKYDCRPCRIRYDTGKGESKIRGENTDTSTTSNEEYEIKRSHFRRDKITKKYFETDSGENADVSDHFATVDINVPSQKSFEATSITFIHQLHNVEPIKKLLPRRSKKCYHVRRKPLTRNLKDLERILKIESRMISDRVTSVLPTELKQVANDNRNNSSPTNFRNIVRKTKQTKSLINPRKNYGARKSRRDKA